MPRIASDLRLISPSGPRGVGAARGPGRKLAVATPIAIVVVMAAVAMIFASLVPTLVVATFFPMVAARHHVPLVPGMIDEIHRVAASVVLAAMPFPVQAVLGRNPQVHGFGRRHSGRPALDDQGLGCDQLRLRILADVDAPVCTRLAELDRYADIGSTRRQANRDRAGRRQGQDRQRLREGPRPSR